MRRQNLNDGWDIREAALSKRAEDLQEIVESTEGWMPARVPTDVRIPLIETGRIQDPVEGLASFESEWIEERSWWFRKVFDVETALLRMDRIELVLESIDGAADIFLNGRHLGRHISAHYPFFADVSRIVKPSANLLAVRLTVGAESVSREMTVPFDRSVGKTPRRGDERRVFLRKPQYVFGWDWGPRIATCGLPNDVYLRGAATVCVADVYARTVSISGERAVVRVSAEIENLYDYATLEAQIELTISRDGADDPPTVVSTGALLQSGVNHLDLDAAVEDPKLWWPNGMGAQHLYSVSLSVSSGGQRDSFEPFEIGIRTLELDTSELRDGERLFAFKVNGRPVFCRGGNWIPADSIYARVTDAKYERLIAEAKEANFTMLRIWGGGIYERETFYAACDHLGILVWHDFMFACALYPDDRDWFRREAEQEIEYQTRRLRSHPCMALWSGNNENHWGFHSWWIGDLQPEFSGGARIYNYLAPRIVRNNCPHIPYWRSSPYGGADPNGSDVGDRHHWHDCTMNPEMDKRITPEEYDKVTSKFVSEYGYIGPCSKASIEQYHAGQPVERFSELWNWHNNTFEKETVVAGITKHYVDADGLSLDDYLLYAGLVQGLMYGYSLESIRCVENCWGSLFWMYDDCWGEVGWTIIDYYLRRKPSYYYVKRAFQPVKLILRRAGAEAVVYGANDTSAEARIPVEFGYAAFDGTSGRTEEAVIAIGANAKGPVLRFPIDGGDERTGVCFVRSAESRELLALLRSAPFRELSPGIPRLELSDFRNGEDGCSFTVSTGTFAHAVHFGIEDDFRLDDSYFDLLPGGSRRVKVVGINGPEDGSARPVSALTVGSIVPCAIHP